MRGGREIQRFREAVSDIEVDGESGCWFFAAAASAATG